MTEVAGVSTSTRSHSVKLGAIPTRSHSAQLGLTRTRANSSRVAPHGTLAAPGTATDPSPLVGGGRVSHSARAPTLRGWRRTVHPWHMVLLPSGGGRDRVPYAARAPTLRAWRHMVHPRPPGTATNHHMWEGGRVWCHAMHARQTLRGRRHMVNHRTHRPHLGHDVPRTPGRCLHLGRTRTFVGAHTLVELGPRSVRTP